VADDHECALVARQPAFQPVDRGKVEVVGRLVEQQQVRLAGQRPAQRGPAAFAAAEALSASRERSMPSWSAMASTSWRGGASSRQREIQQGIVAGEERVLFQRDDPRARLDRALAPVSLDLSGDQLEQGGLAGAVATDQRQPVARADVQVEVPGRASRNPGSGRGLPS
jgi:hypothetical protein